MLATGLATGTAGLATSTTLRQANSIRATLHSLAGHLADTADGIGGALQGLAEEANNVRHFY
jgi:hypothetical protein